MSSVRMNAGRVVDLDLWKSSQLEVFFFSQISDIATLFLRPYPVGRVITDNGAQFQRLLTGADSGAQIDLRLIPINQPTFFSTISAWPDSVRTIVNGYQVPTGLSVSATPNIVASIPAGTSPVIVVQSISSTGPGPQVSLGFVTAEDNATTYSVTIGAHSVSVVGAGGGSIAVADDLRDACNASSDPGFTAITWFSFSLPTDRGALRATADVNGVAFSATLSAAGGTGTVEDFVLNPDPPVFISENDFDPLDTWQVGELVNLSNPAL